MSETDGEGYETCGCCEAGEYAGDETAEDVSCPACGHAPEEHLRVLIFPAGSSQAAVLEVVDRFLAKPDVGMLPMRKVS